MGPICIFDLWTQGPHKLNEFTEFIISLYPTIKFTLVSSPTSLNVLYLTLNIVDGYIQTDIYSKPTDNHLYLLRKSAHPTHCTKAKFPSTDCIVEAVQICLEHNNLQFQEENYLQIHGSAMGPQNACSYTDLPWGLSTKEPHPGKLGPIYGGDIGTTFSIFGPRGHIN